MWGFSLGTAKFNQPSTGHSWSSQSEGGESEQWVPEQWGSAHVVMGCHSKTHSVVSVHWGHRIMENQSQNTVCAEAGHCLKFSAPLLETESTNCRKRLSRPQPCLHLTVWDSTGADHSLCVYMCVRLSMLLMHRALFVPLLLGLLMKESNWIFWAWCRGVQERAGSVQTPWREGRRGGQTCRLDYHCALFFLALSSQGRGLLFAWAGRLVRKHFISSAC